jgi:hypothetical protein
MDHDETVLAPFRQRFARDPFEARATGGYSITTMDYAIRGASEEEELIANVVNACRSLPPGSLLRRKDRSLTNPLYDWKIEPRGPLSGSFSSMNPYMQRLHDLITTREEVGDPEDGSFVVHDDEDHPDADHYSFYQEIVESVIPEYEAQALRDYRPLSPGPGVVETDYVPSAEDMVDQFGVDGEPDFY